MIIHVSKREVEFFKSMWPCSGLPSQAVQFEFASNGDLVDITPRRYAHLFDGPAAAAMADDAKAGKIGRTK